MYEHELKYHPEALNDMDALDRSQQIAAQKAAKKLQFQPNQCGKPLGNRHGLNLTGLRRIKIKTLGIRIVYLPPSREGEAVLILAVGKREDDEVYREALRRYRNL